MEPALLLFLALLVVLLVVLLLGGVRERRLDRVDRRIARLDRKVDRIMDHLDIQEFGPGELESVEALLWQGKKIEAIKLYCQIKGVELKEAKAAVDRMAG